MKRPTLHRFHLLYYSNGNSGKDKKNAKDTMLVIDTRGKQAAAVVEKTPIEEDADVEQDPLELAIRTKYVAFSFVSCFFRNQVNRRCGARHH